jgi:thioredoxin-like negative regulator of GroEL
LDQTPKEKLDLTRLRARLGEKPRTKTGQIRQAWPHIKDLFDAGHTLKDIHVWLNEAGIEIGYARLSTYLGQLRRRDQATALAETVSALSELTRVPDHARSSSGNGAAQETRGDPDSASAANDPLANVREREGRRSGFQFNSEPDSKKLI